MALDPKATPARDRNNMVKGIRIFTYPKLIFIFPTLVAALLCGMGMSLLGNPTEDPLKRAPTGAAVVGGAEVPVSETQPNADRPQTVGTVKMAKHQRFVQPQNLLGILFLGILAFNLVVMGIDFPRFTVVAVMLVVLLAMFILLWIGAYFDYDLMGPARVLFGSIYTVANSGFYYMIAAILVLNFVIIYATRWLDYWEILPNEILHHHGPLSDLERFPTTNLKFDKEIPDVFEYLFLGAGRLVLHVTEERKAIVLDNVLFIGTKETALKRLMSRLEVRVTTDQEITDA
jgi:hypothetical protein